MRRTVRKWFWVWDFDKEEKWLNEMAAKGLCLVGVGFCRYEFEDCVPGEYAIRLERLEQRVSHPESVKYLEFLEETGAEHVGTFQNQWVYLRKKKADGDFQLFSDNDSRITHLGRIIAFVTAIVVLNYFIGLYNLFLVFYWGSTFNLLGIANLLIGILGSVGILKLHKKKKRLEADRQLFE